MGQGKDHSRIDDFLSAATPPLSAAKSNRVWLDMQRERMYPCRVGSHDCCDTGSGKLALSGHLQSLWARRPVVVPSVSAATLPRWRSVRPAYTSLGGASGRRSNPPVTSGGTRPVSGFAWLMASPPPRHYHERDEYGGQDSQEDRRKLRPAAGDKVRKHHPPWRTYVDVSLSQQLIVGPQTRTSSLRW